MGTHDAHRERARKERHPRERVPNKARSADHRDRRGNYCAWGACCGGIALVPSMPIDEACWPFDVGATRCPWASKCTVSPAHTRNSMRISVLTSTNDVLAVLRAAEKALPSATPGSLNQLRTKRCVAVSVHAV